MNNVIIKDPLLFSMIDQVGMTFIFFLITPIDEPDSCCSNAEECACACLTR